MLQASGNPRPIAPDGGRVEIHESHGIAVNVEFRGYVCLEAPGRGGRLGRVGGDGQDGPADRGDVQVIEQGPAIAAE